MTEPGWAHDDESIPNHELFLRRVPRLPDCYVVDAITAQYEIREGALTFDDNGMSIHSDAIRADLEVPRAQVVHDWTTHTAIEFPAGAVRSGEGGIHRDVDPDDDTLGAAHALVQGKSRPGKPPKGERKKIRQHIVDNCRILDEDPHKP